MSDNRDFMYRTSGLTIVDGLLWSWIWFTDNTLQNFPCLSLQYHCVDYHLDCSSVFDLIKSVSYFKEKIFKSHEVKRSQMNTKSEEMNTNKSKTKQLTIGKGGSLRRCIYRQTHKIELLEKAWSGNFPSAQVRDRADMFERSQPRWSWSCPILEVCSEFLVKILTLLL